MTAWCEVFSTCVRKGVVVGLAVTLAGGGGCAAAAVYNPGHVPRAQMSRIEAACAMVARLPDGSVYDLNVCEESLSRSLAARLKTDGSSALRMPAADLTAQGRPTRREREERACAAIGFDASGEAFGQCVADLNAELSAADRPIM